MYDTRKKTNSIIKMLNGRNGFDCWFGNIDEDIKEEILSEINEIIEASQ